MSGMLDIVHEHSTLIIAGSYLLLELLAILAAIHAVMQVRTAQGAVAWLIALVTIPFLALPLYAIFGRRRFMGYVSARRARDAAIEHYNVRPDPSEPGPFNSESSGNDARFNGFEKLAGTPFLNANGCRLLVNGQDTFDAIFAALREAGSYVLIQFYIVRDDDLGQQLKQHLLDCLSRNVRVYLLYDAVGSSQLSSDYGAELRAAGAQVQSFSSTTRRVRRLQINFRNHRKIVVVDGHTTFVGGHNVGNEYLGLDQHLSPWRDTHVQVHGSVAAATQIPFAEDWFWSTGELPLLDWGPASGADKSASGTDKSAPADKSLSGADKSAPADKSLSGADALKALSLPSGPADDVEVGCLMFVHAINAATRRLWIVSPYFVPNGSIIDALMLAALRDVDVRILLPGITDNRLAQLAGRAYLQELIPSGIRIFRYTGGFLHQKVMLIDGDLATVGTANLDNRSMRLNFELTLVFAGNAFARKIEHMLIDDFAAATEVDAPSVANESWWVRAASRGARLLAPVL